MSRGFLLPPYVGLSRSFFFFQAEDGIRDPLVTGVQTWLFRSPIRLEYARNADQDSPAAVHVQRIVGSVRVVLVERNLTVDFDWMCVDCHMDSERLQLCHELEVEVGDRARDQRHTAGAAVAGRDGQLMFDRVEVDLEDT